MPHCTIPIDNRGPIINVFIGVSAQRKIALHAALQIIPPPIQVSMLIDTGASITAIDKSIISQLNLVAKGTEDIRTPSTGDTPHQCFTYDVEIIILAGVGTVHHKHIPALPIIDGNFLLQGHHGLIGRDILASSRMMYSGVDNIVMLSLI